MRRHIRGDEPDIVDGQPPVTNGRLARGRVILEDESPMCKGPGIRTPAALSVCRRPVIAARSADPWQIGLDTNPEASLFRPPRRECFAESASSMAGLVGSSASVRLPCAGVTAVPRGISSRLELAGNRDGPSGTCLPLASPRRLRVPAALTRGFRLDRTSEPRLGFGWLELRFHRSMPAALASCGR